MIRINRISTVVRAEMVKSFKNTFTSKSKLFPALIWPIIIFLTTYFTYLSFDVESANLPYGINDFNALLVFLLVGFMAYNTFWSMVTSAWGTAMERQNGTLEIIFLSPANRMAIMYGRALSSLLVDMWMFISFSTIVFVLIGDFSASVIAWLAVAYLLLVICAVAWGGLMNALYLLSRDANYLFNLCDAPMNFFSGVRMPISVFPVWARVISYVFPLTYCLTIIRSVILTDFQGIAASQVIVLILLLTVLVSVTKLVLFVGERNNRKSGNLVLY